MVQPFMPVERLLVYTSSKYKGTSQRKLPLPSLEDKQHDPKTFNELNSDSQNSNPAKYSLQSGANIASRNLSATRNAERMIKRMLSVSVADPVRVSVSDKQDTSISGIPVEQAFSMSTTDVAAIVLSDNDEQEANIADISAGRRVMESPEISIWHCVGLYGEKRGPYSMSVLKRLSETASYPLDFKVWKTSQ